MDAPGHESADLDWSNVGLALAFIGFNALASHALGLGVGGSLVTAALRCVGQLSVMALVLRGIFAMENPWAVAGMVLLLNLLGTIETVTNKVKMRYDYMFVTVLASMLVSIIPVSIIGAKYCLAIEPFWAPARYVPVVGMLTGTTISGIILSLNHVLRELHTERDKIETYLAFGASRLEACRPIATTALRTALTPSVNQMSVLGLIAIPGMMTGALLGGASVQQAARLQMVIIFMISASTAFASIVATTLTLGIIVDAEARVRIERVDPRKAAIWRARDHATGAVAGWLKGLWQATKDKVRGQANGNGQGEREPLLGQ